MLIYNILMAPKKVTRKNLKKSIKSSRTKKLPQNLKDISVKKSMKESNKLNPTFNNFLISLLFLKKKYNNFEVIYEYKKYNKILFEITKKKEIVYPFGKEKFTKILKSLLDNYSSKKKRFVILPIAISFHEKYLFLLKKLNYHQNIIIIDLKEKKAEYFEPHGGLYSKSFKTRIFTYHKQDFFIQMFKNSLEMYENISPIFKKLKLKFVLPHHYLGMKDFQAIEFMEPYINNIKILIESNDIIVFSSKTCKYGKNAIQALREAGYNPKFVNVKTLPNRDKLTKLVGKASVPQVFVKGKHIGGCNDGGIGGTMKCIANGTIKKLLEERKQKNPIPDNRKTDISGYCHNWCIWFISLRLKYPDTDLKELIKKSHTILKTQYTYKNFIRNYSKNIYENNKTLLEKNNLNIFKKIFNGEKEYDKKLKKLVEKHFTIYK